MENIDYTKSPLVKKFIELEDSKNKVKNIFLFAGGGYGKTTAMCCLFKYLLDKASNGAKIAPIYIDVKKLNFNKLNPIISYIHSKYSGSDTQESDVENLFSDQAPEFSKKYTYYILIDGLNETNDGNKGNLIDIISDMTQISNVRFVVSSRIKETFDKAPFCTFKLQKLNEEQIKEYLDKNFGKKYNEQTHVDEINKSLIEILQIPMFMKTFSKTYDKRSPYPDIYDEKTVRKADILDSYVQRILLNLKERTNSYDNNILEFVINFYLPALAFQMAEENVLNIDSEIVDKKLCLDYFLSFFKGTKKEQIKSLINDKKFMPISISSKNFALINDNVGNYSFVHQIWRDFFAAKHIINCMNAELLDELEISVDENIRQFVGELVREYDAENKFSKEFSYEKKIDENGKIIYVEKLDTRKCECDFESVAELKVAKKSPLNQFLQRHNLQKDEKERLSPTQTSNVIEIMKTSRNNSITADYSHLNLINTILFDKDICDISNSKFDFSYISNDCFSLFCIQGEVCSMTLSKSNKLFINALGNIYVINLLDESIVDYVIKSDEDGYFCGGKIFVSENENFVAVIASSIEKVMIYNIDHQEYRYVSFDSSVNEIIDAFNFDLKFILSDFIEPKEAGIEELKNLINKYKNTYVNEIRNIYFNGFFNSINFVIDNQYILLKNSAEENKVVCKIKDDYNISSFKLCDDNKKLFTSNTNGEIKEYDICIQENSITLNSNKRSPIINSHLYGLTYIEVNDKYISILNGDYIKVYINNENKWKEIKRYVIGGIGVLGASYTLNKCFYTIANTKRTFLNVDVYDICQSKHISYFKVPITNDYKYNYFTYSTDALYIALLSTTKNTVEIWDVFKERKIKEIKLDESVLNQKSFYLEFSYDNSILNIIGFDSFNNIPILIKSITLKGITQPLSYTIKNADYFRFHINKFHYFENFETHYFRTLNSDFSFSKFIDFKSIQLIYLLNKFGGKISKDWYDYFENNIVENESYKKIGEKMDVRIPIKEIIDTVIRKNSCIYNEEYITLMRKFFIGCLNLGYIEEDNIYNIVRKIGKIKEIVHKDSIVNVFEHYYIENGILYIEKQKGNESYILDFYKALSEIMFNSPNFKNNSLYCALTEMLSEKVYNMDINGSKIIMPKSEQYMVGEKKLDLRAGYKRCNLTINLLKQLFIYKGINENEVISNIINGNGFENEIAKITDDEDVKVLFNIIEKISLMDRNRIITGKVNHEEMEYIIEYQKKINDLFVKMDQNYFAFLALITSDDLRAKCIKKFDNNY